VKYKTQFEVYFEKEFQEQRLKMKEYPTKEENRFLLEQHVMSSDP